ncbi:agmatinase [Bacteroidota bacterium]
MLEFGDFPPIYTSENSSKIIIQPVLFDGTSTWIKGSNMGAKALLGASCKLEFFDIETNTEVFKKGIHTIPPLQDFESVEGMKNKVYKSTLDWINKDRFIVTIGGEHSVSIGAIQAFSENYHDLNVLQLDAHADLRDEYNGSRLNHACVMARVAEFCPSVQVGIRSLDISEKEKIKEEKIFYAQHIYNNSDWYFKAINQLSSQVYITLDLDVFDTSIMPSTGTPEPGGLSWYGVLKFLKLVFESRNVVGFDIVELCPDINNKAPDFLAAKLLYKMLSYKFA